MNRGMKVFSAALMSAAVLAVLSACGGGGGDDTPAALTAVPDSANASGAAYTAFAGSQASDDGTEPISMNSAQPPTSETDEPVALS